MAVGAWGIAPSEFWKMTPMEWWWLYEVKRELQGMPPSAQSIKDELRENEEFAAKYGEMYRRL